MHYEHTELLNKIKTELFIIPLHINPERNRQARENILWAVLWKRTITQSEKSYLLRTLQEVIAQSDGKKSGEMTS